MAINPNLKTLMEADFNKVYLYKKDEAGNLGTCSKSFLGKLWLCLTGNKANAKSEIVSAVIDKLITFNTLENLKDVSQKSTLKNNLGTLEYHFTHITRVDRKARIIKTMKAVIDRILLKSTSSIVNPPQTVGAQRARAESLTDLFPSTGDVVPVKPQPKPAKAQQAGISAPASRVLRGVAYGPQDALVAAISRDQTTQEVKGTESRIKAKNDGRDVLEVPRFVLERGTATIQATTYRDTGYHIRNHKLRPVT